MGHQYNHVLDLLEGFGELCSLWRKPQNKYRALCGLQEYARVASSLCRESAHAIHVGRMRQAAATIIPALIDKVYEMLSTEEGPSSPNLQGQWPKIRSLLRLGPPDLNQGYYFLGLLDCAAQLATLGIPNVLKAEFDEKLGRLIVESTVRQYTWKAVSSTLISFPRMLKIIYINLHIILLTW